MSKESRLASGRRSYAKHREKRLAARRLKPRVKRPYKKIDPKRRLANYIKSAYGITIAEYRDLLSRQLGCCAICRCLPSSSAHGRLYVDHDHHTGAVRGLLCNLCNCALGNFRDSIVSMKHAIDYLERNNGN